MLVLPPHRFEDDGHPCGALVAATTLAALAGGRAILKALADGDAAPRRKDDGSPVTDADLRAEDAIRESLHRACPEARQIGEERGGDLDANDSGAFFLIDPLDGTKEFVAGSPDFTVNAALSAEGRPVLGAVYAPMHEAMFCALAEDAVDSEGRRLSAGAYRFDVAADATRIDYATRRRLRCRTRPSRFSEVTVVSSRSHGSGVESSLGGRSRRAGSSLKFCLLASGEADVYPRVGRTMEWDTAAGDAVLRAAGGFTRVGDGSALRYGKREAGFANDGGFIASGPGAPIGLELLS